MRHHTIGPVRKLFQFLEDYDARWYAIGINHLHNVNGHELPPFSFLRDIGRFRKKRADKSQKDAGRRNECYDGLPFPPERETMQQGLRQVPAVLENIWRIFFNGETC